MVPLGKASFALYPQFVAEVEEISGKSTGFRPKGTLEALFSHDTKAELSTIIALHHGLGLKAEPLRAEDARELEPALSEEVEAAVLRPEEGSVDNRLSRPRFWRRRNAAARRFFLETERKRSGAREIVARDWFCRMKKWKPSGRSSPQVVSRPRSKGLRGTHL